jgi:hypothetical protein
MVIENKGEYDILELLEYKHSIKQLDFRNISEIKNINLLKEFNLLSEIKFSTCFVENNMLDLSNTMINSLSISNCYFELNNIIMPPDLKKIIIKLTSISDFHFYKKLKNIVNLEHDLCDFKALLSNKDITQLKKIEIISFINCKGLFNLDALFQKNIPIKILLKNTDLTLNTEYLHNEIDLEIESFQKIKIKNNSIIITSR